MVPRESFEDKDHPRLAGRLTAARHYFFDVPLSTFSTADEPFGSGCSG
jgi:hypothetical protein